MVIPGMHSSNVILLPQSTEARNKAAHSASPQMEQPPGINAKNNPTELILQAAMEKINEIFSPHLGDGAVGRAVESGQDMSPEATADRILSFATQIIGRVESQQADLPADEQRSREQLFNNIQLGIERGFEQARGILDGLQALNGETVEGVDATYAHVQSGLSKLALLLGLEAPEQTVA